MANTLPSLSLITQEALPVLQAAVPALTVFSTDFSADVAAQGSAIATRIPQSMTAAAYSAATGYVGTDVNPTAVTVTLNQHYHVTNSFTDAEVANLTLPRLMNTFITPAINGVVNKVAADVFALVTLSNYGTHAYSGSTATFANVFQTPMALLAASGVSPDKALVLNPSGYYSLMNDIKASNVIGDATVIRDGVIGKLGGATVVMAGGLPTNSESLFGFACGKEAIAIATRVPNLAGVSSALLEIENVTDENSGLTVQLRKWYSPDKGLWNISAIVIYGVAKGNGSALQRLRQ